MKILAFSSTRADYDLMCDLYRLLHQDTAIDFRLLVSGAQLSKQHGDGIRHIEQEGFKRLATLETLAAEDTKRGQLQTASHLLAQSIEPIAAFNPDLVLYVGDREDIIVYAMIAGYLQIPAIHFWSGDHASDGNIDNITRHAASKFANLFFVSLEQHKQRLIAMGEQARRIFCVGSMALDSFRQSEPVEKTALKQQLGLPQDFGEYALLIFHPLPSEKQHYGDHFKTIIESVLAKGYSLCISAPNTDPGNSAAFEVIEHYQQHPNCFYYENINRNAFISMYQHAKFIIGNSSSGIVEAASIPIAAVNVGQRQRGRYCEDNVIFCDINAAAIGDAIATIETDAFNQHLATMNNPYGDGRSAKRAYELIKTLHLKDYLVKSEDPLKQGEK